MKHKLHTLGMLVAMSMLAASVPFDPEKTGSVYIPKIKLEEHYIDKGAIPKPYIKRDKLTRKQRRKGKK